jgi:hypothetical protein
MSRLPLWPRVAIFPTQVGPASALKVGPAYALISNYYDCEQLDRLEQDVA